MDAWLAGAIRTLTLLGFAAGLPVAAAFYGVNPRFAPEDAGAASLTITGSPEGPATPQVAAEHAPPRASVTTAQLSTANFAGAASVPADPLTPLAVAPPPLSGPVNYEVQPTVQHSVQSTTPPMPGAPAAEPDRFTLAQQRLKQLGATYLLLESFGERSDQFRCHCELGTPGSERAGRCFELTAPHPLAALEGVLAQVERAVAPPVQMGERVLPSDLRRR